jgi:hypothetical protein
VALNRSLPFSAEIDDYFQERFSGKRFVYCENGRQALNLALKHLGMRAEDCVTILTTTSNFYISSCVTREIEQFCRWSRQLTHDTRAVLVNHEFGFGYEKLRELQRLNLPIIEDAAHSFASDNTERSISQVGEFTVYSFPKFFPIQVGGLLAFQDRFDVAEPVDPETKRYLQKVLSHYLRELDNTKEKRCWNYQYLAERFETLGFVPRFSLAEYSVPGVFMFRADGRVDLSALKSFLWNQGLECSVFYGEDAFFIPVNQRLEKDDLDYFFEAVRFFVNQNRKDELQPIA